MFGLLHAYSLQSSSQTIFYLSKQKEHQKYWTINWLIIKLCTSNSNDDCNKYNIYINYKSDIVSIISFQMENLQELGFNIRGTMRSI